MRTPYSTADDVAVYQLGENYDVKLLDESSPIQAISNISMDNPKPPWDLFYLCIATSRFDSIQLSDCVRWEQMSHSRQEP